MKSNYETMDALVAKVQALEARKHDVIADTRKLVFAEPDAEHSGDWLQIERDGNYPVTEFASGQVMDGVGIPRRYAAEARKVPGLVAHNVNAWFQQAPQKRLVRAYTDGPVRAFLSNSYKPMDNSWALEAIMPVLMQHQDLAVMSRVLTESRLYLQVGFQNMVEEVKQGDPVMWGLAVSTSEVGLGAFDIATMTWNLACTNGAIGGTVMRKVHLGRPMQDDGDLWQRDTILANMKALQLMARDAVAAAVDQGKFLQVVGAMRAGREDRIADLPAVVRNIPTVFDVSEEQAQVVAANMISTGEFNRYGLGQGLTWLAHEIDNRDRAFDLEKAGYGLLAESDGWREVTKPARNVTPSNN